MRHQADNTVLQRSNNTLLLHHKDRSNVQTVPAKADSTPGPNPANVRTCTSKRSVQHATATGPSKGLTPVAVNAKVKATLMCSTSRARPLPCIASGRAARAKAGRTLVVQRRGPKAGVSHRFGEEAERAFNGSTPRAQIVVGAIEKAEMVEALK